MNKVQAEVLKAYKQGKSSSEIMEHVMTKAAGTADYMEMLKQFEKMVAEEKFDPEALKKIKEISKSIRTKMKRKDTNPKTLLDFLVSIAEYANKENYMRPVAECGILDILFLLGTHPNKEIQLSSLFLLSELAIDDSNAIRFQKEGAVGLALQAGDSDYDHARIYSVKLLGELAKVPHNNTSLSLHLLQNSSFVKNIKWMNSIMDPYSFKVVTSHGIINFKQALSLISMRTLGLVSSGKMSTQKAEELELFDPLVKLFDKGFSNVSEKNIMTIAIWALGRAYTCGGLTRLQGKVKDILIKYNGHNGSISSQSNLFTSNQEPFVPVPAPIFEYDLASAQSSFEVENPKNLTLRRCALLSCNKKETPEEKLLACGGCRVSFYCCRAHQVQDWKEGHKERCKKREK